MSEVTIYTYLSNESTELQIQKIETTKNLIKNYLFEDGKEIVLHPLVAEVRARNDVDVGALSPLPLPPNTTNSNSTLPSDPIENSTPTPSISAMRKNLLKRKFFKPAPIILNSKYKRSGLIGTKNRNIIGYSSSIDIDLGASSSSPELEIPVIRIIPNSSGAIEEEVEEEERDEEMADIIIEGWDDEVESLLAVAKTSASSVVVVSKKDEVVIDLGKDAIKRCIPRPYSLPFPEIGNMNPEIQHLTAIKYSFLDPISSLPLSISRNSQFPLALSNLSLGRRGSWIIPITTSNKISSKVLNDSISKATWNERIGNCDIPSKIYIYWNEDRLKSLWDIIRNLNISGNMGSVYATCNFSENFINSTTSTTNKRTKNQEMSDYFRSIDHIRISVDAHLALPLRTLLGLTDARKSKSKSTNLVVGGEGVENLQDKEKFLRNSGLVWINESGEFVLVA